MSKSRVKGATPRMASVCTPAPFRFDDPSWRHPFTPPRPLRGWACRRHCRPPPLPRSHPLRRPGGCRRRQRRGAPAPPASRIGSSAVPPVPAWVQRGLHSPHRGGRAGVSLLSPLACAKGRARGEGARGGGWGVSPSSTARGCTHPPCPSYCCPATPVARNRGETVAQQREGSVSMTTLVPRTRPLCTPPFTCHLVHAVPHAGRHARGTRKAGCAGILYGGRRGVVLTRDAGGVCPLPSSLPLLLPPFARLSQSMPEWGHLSVHHSRRQGGGRRGGAGVMPRAPAFPCPVEAQTRPPFVHKQGRDQGGGGGSHARCPVRMSGGEGRKGVRTFWVPPYIPRLRRGGVARTRREQGTPLSTLGAQGGTNWGADRWGARSKKGGSMQTQFACSLPSLCPPFACRVARKGRGRQQW